MHIVLPIFAILIAGCTLLPLIRHDYWTFRVFDYPRIQKLVLTLIWLVVFFSAFSAVATWHWVMAAAMVANAIYLTYQILPFTPLSRKQVQRATYDDPGNSISILIANVYEDNTNSRGCLQVVQSCDADIVLLVETNKRWERETTTLDDRYPHRVKVPLENTYGMLFFSKLPLVDTSVEYLVEHDIPSIHGKIKLPSGQLTQFHAIHPTPPVPNENPRSTERDKELLLVADCAKHAELPVIVIGDLNDVAWSYTTELFLKMSGLLDPRRGRGFYNTFHARHRFMRFPLDHAFISPHFKLKALRRPDNFDSDHFPIFIDLQYEQQAKRQQEDQQLEATAADHAEAREKKGS